MRGGRKNNSPIFHSPSTIVFRPLHSDRSPLKPALWLVPPLPSSSRASCFLVLLASPSVPAHQSLISLPRSPSYLSEPEPGIVPANEGSGAAQGRSAAKVGGPRGAERPDPSLEVGVAVQETSRRTAVLSSLSLLISLLTMWQDQRVVAQFEGERQPRRKPATLGDPPIPSSASGGRKGQSGGAESDRASVSLLDFDLAV
jgi:hypothetical protein